MKTHKTLLPAILLSLLLQTTALTARDSLMLRLQFLAEQLIDSRPEIRQQAHARLTETLLALLQQNDSWQQNFDKLPTISIQIPADSSFRFFTWQCEMPDGSYRHGGVLQKRDAPQNPIALRDQPPEARFSEYTSGYADDWIGGICYALYPFTTEDQQTAWLAFFYDSYSPYIARKWMDVLWFDQEQNLRFGLPVFPMPDKFGGLDKHSRVLMEYYRYASTRFNYDEELQVVIKDHIIPYGMLPDNSAPAPVPDGSYEGFRYKNGLWIYDDKLFHQALRDNEAPRPFPILDKQKDKDIFGRKQ